MGHVFSSAFNNFAAQSRFGIDAIQVLLKQAFRPNSDVTVSFLSDDTLSIVETDAFAIIAQPAVTKDGAAIVLNLNAGFLLDLQSLAETNADGIGLYRTEMPFLALRTLPDVKDGKAWHSGAIDVKPGQ